MRKAYTVAAIAVAGGLALAAPAGAFAADATPSPTASQSAAPEQNASISLSSSTVRPGESVTVTASGPQGKPFTVSSPVFGGGTIAGKGEFSHTFTVDKNAKPGTYHVTLQGRDFQAGAQLTVKGDTPSPAPQASLSLSADSGKPGDKVGITIKAGDLKGDAYVTSDAFGGKVALKQDRADGTWHGQATVSKDTKLGYYGVTGYVGSTKVDTVKFTVTEGGTTPVVGRSSISVSPGEGHAGDLVKLAVKAPSANPTGTVTVDSKAFTGQARLTLGKDGVWKGTARVGNVRPNTYKVRSGTGAETSFKVLGGGGHDSDHHGVTPVKPGDHKIPKGSVNTGMAPVGDAQENTNAALAIGLGGLGASAVAGAGLLRRRRNHG
ncbi:hypothetical protein ACFQVC_19275 [Streptomyces monticola]|uniref:Gram-positive cocci surface proteins LPxTG domain-containing protein n=1 Tax=Streptomyces monticola TaxID=2666263 RepID=A0ABW2JLK8_9ACTN